MNDDALREGVRAALGARDRAMPPPGFEVLWQRAAATRPAVPAEPRWLGWLEPSLALAAIAAIAIAALWQFAGRPQGDAPWTLAADLQLARELAPARQWPTATAGLLRVYDYGPSTVIDMPRIENPFEESLL